MKRRTAAVAAVCLVLLLSVSLYYVGTKTPVPGTSSATSITGPSSSTGGSVEVTSSESQVAGNWTTYHADNSRTGYEGVSNFTSVTAGWTSPALDGDVYAEPLVYQGSVFVATENNSVYSLSAVTGAVVWRTNLGPPVGGNELQCGDINPSGITGTPVIDTSTGTIFVVAFSHLQHFLYGLNVQTGAVVSNQSADPAGFVPTAQQQRSALSLSDGMVYVPYGGLAGDCGNYHGWVVGLPANTSARVSMDVYQVPTSREGGIWGPSGAAVDSSGTLYVTTGNGASDTTFDHGDAVISLSPALDETGYFAPSNWVQLNEDDGDLGSVGPSIVAPGTLFQIGKQGVGYLLNAESLGGIGGQEFSAEVCDGSYGGTAEAGSSIFVPCTNGLFAIQLDGSSFSRAWSSSSFDAGPPIVTGGVVWSVDISSATLYGFGVSTGRLLYSFPLGTAVHFVTPSAGDGRVFVGEGDVVAAFVLGTGQV